MSFLTLAHTASSGVHGFILGSDLFAEVCWEQPVPDSPLGQCTFWGTPEAMRRLAAHAVQAAIEAEEEACWQAHQATAVRKQRRGRVA